MTKFIGGFMFVVMGLCALILAGAVARAGEPEIISLMAGAAAAFFVVMFVMFLVTTIARGA